MDPIIQLGKTEATHYTTTPTPRLIGIVMQIWSHTRKSQSTSRLFNLLHWMIRSSGHHLSHMCQQYLVVWIESLIRYQANPGHQVLKDPNGLSRLKGSSNKIHHLQEFLDPWSITITPTTQRSRNGHMQLTRRNRLPIRFWMNQRGKQK